MILAAPVGNLLEESLFIQRGKDIKIIPADLARMGTALVNKVGQAWKNIIPFPLPEFLRKPVGPDNRAGNIENFIKENSGNQVPEIFPIPFFILFMCEI